MTRIPDELREIALTQDGLVTRSQAIACGMTSNQVQRLGEPGGRGSRVLRGVYSLTTGSLSRRQQIRSVLLYAGESAALTGPTALELEGLRYAPNDSRVHVLLPAQRKVTPRPVMLVTRTARMPAVRSRDGLPVVAAYRAVVDAVRHSRHDRDAVALVAEAVQKRLCTLDMLADEVAAGPRVGSSRVRRAVQALERGPASAPENDLACLLATSILLPPPTLNAPMEVDGHRVVTDACWPQARLIVEVDSVEHHGFGADAEWTSRRRSGLTAAGWTVLSVSPQRLRDDPSGVLREIEAAFVRGIARQAS